MAKYHDVVELSQLEPWRLGQIVLQNEAFSELRHKIVDRYGPAVLDPQHLISIEPAQFKKVTSAILTGIENQLKVIGDRLYDEICVKRKWCKNRERSLVENAEMGAAGLEIFTGTNGAIVLSVLLIKRKFLDNLCNCPKQN